MGPRGWEWGVEKVHSLYRPPNKVFKSTRLRWVGHLARMKEGRSAFKIPTGKLTRKKLLERLMHRWEDNISMDLKEIWGITLIRLRIVIFGEPF